jgi:signal transduction histidine kinase
MSHRGTREAALALQRLNETLENEAKRIAHALHYEAGQLLASVHIALAELAPTLPVPAREKLGEITQLLKDSEDALRDLSHELRPMVLEHLGLLPALRFLAEKAARRNHLSITVHGNSHTRMPASVESAVYRATQEALNNVVKHARARSVRIRLRCGSRWVSCIVQDDGVGLAKSLRREEQMGLGLIGIRERLGTLGGSFRIVSRAQQGTTLLLVVPLEN